MSGSIRLGHIFSIPVQVNYTWFIVFGLVSWILSVSYYPPLYPDWTDPQYWLAGIVTALFYFASVVAHELGHSLVAIRSNLPIRSITLFVFGGVALLEREPDTPVQELKIAAAGPAVSFIVAAVFILIYYTRIDYVSAVALYLAYINLLLAIFNLLPGFPLDGGRVLRSLLWWRLGSLTSATRIASGLGQVIAFGFMAVGVIGFLAGSLLSLWWLLLGWFLVEGARSGLRHVIINQALGDITIREIMSGQVIVLPVHVTVEEAINNYFLRHSQGGFPVTGDDDQLIGFVTLEDVRAASPEQRKLATVSSIMTPVDSLHTLNPDDSCFSALMLMAKSKVGRLPVVAEGRLVGLVSRDHLLNVLRLRAQ